MSIPAIIISIFTVIIILFSLYVNSRLLSLYNTWLNNHFEINKNSISYDKDEIDDNNDSNINIDDNLSGSESSEEEIITHSNSKNTKPTFSNQRPKSKIHF